MKSEPALIVAVAVALFAHPSPTRGEGGEEEYKRLFNVHALYQACTSPRGSQMFGRCFGYIEGVGDSMIGKTFCVKNDLINYPAWIQAFVNWVPAHPERWDDLQLIGVMDALAETWPCAQ
jgi:hypothetical protein